MKRILMLTMTLALGAAATAPAALVEQVVTYTQGGTTLEGFLAYDDAVAGPRPGVLVVHQWMGLTDNERMRAEMLAELGYVALAADVYGQGVRPPTPTRPARRPASTTATGRCSGRASPPAWPSCRPTRWWTGAHWRPSATASAAAACSSWPAAGADLAGVVSFHGSLDTPLPAAPGRREGQGAGLPRRGRSLREARGRRTASWTRWRPPGWTTS